jgi:DNA repair photolyase/intein/homing endonuclease
LRTLPPQLRITEVSAKSILNPSRISGITYAINPYIGCQHACAYCLHPTSLILTEHGFIEIQNIRSGKKPTTIFTHKGRLRSVEQVFKHSYEGLLRHITMRYYRDLRVTPNHRILVIKRKKLICKMDGFSICYPNREDNGKNQTRRCAFCKNKNEIKPILVEARELEKGDFIIVPIPKESKDAREIQVNEILEKGEFSDLLENDAIGFKRGKSRIPNTIKLSDSFFRLVGYYISEGCVTSAANRPNSAQLVFTFHEDERLFINDVSELLKQYFKIEPTIVAGSPKTTRIEVYSNILAKFFETLFGERAENMKVPSWFLFLPINKQKEFLKGLFRGDGSITNNKARPTNFVTTSENIRDAVQTMLLRLQIPSGFSISKIGKKRKTTAYIIAPAGTFRKKFSEIFGIDKTVKNAHNVYVGITHDFVFVPINDIVDEPYIGYVYNLQIEEDRTYVANYAAVSNCYARFMTRYTGHLGEEWGRFVDVKVNAPRVLHHQLRRRKKTKKEPVLFSSVTDAYQPLERRYQVTRNCINLLCRHGFPISILTKSDLVLRDADLLGQSSENEVGMTIITLNEKVRRVFESGAIPSNRRLETLRQISAQGIRTYGFVGPIIPELSTAHLDELIREMAECGVAYALFDRLNIKYGNRPVIEQALRTHFAEKAKSILDALRPGSQYYEVTRSQIIEYSRQYGLEADVLF